jgi:hypothetical protein
MANLYLLKGVDKSFGIDGSFWIHNLKLLQTLS